jgi:hypothetical protein
MEQFMAAQMQLLQNLTATIQNLQPQQNHQLLHAGQPPKRQA